METGETSKAVELFPHVYTTPDEWKEQINGFTQKNQLDVRIDGRDLNENCVIDLDYLTVYSNG